MSEPLVVAKDLVKQFPVRGGVFQRQIATVNAVAGVDPEFMGALDHLLGRRIDRGGYGVSKFGGLFYCGFFFDCH